MHKRSEFKRPRLAFDKNMVLGRASITLSARSLTVVSVLLLAVGCGGGSTLNEVTKIQPLQSKMDEIAKNNSIELAKYITDKIWSKSIRDLDSIYSKEKEEKNSKLISYIDSSKNSSSGCPKNLHVKFHPGVANIWSDFSNLWHPNPEYDHKRSVLLKKSSGATDNESPEIAELNKSIKSVASIKVSITYSEDDGCQFHYDTPFNNDVFIEELSKYKIFIKNCRDSNDIITQCFTDHFDEDIEKLKSQSRQSKRDISWRPSFALGWFNNGMCESDPCYNDFHYFDAKFINTKGEENNSLFEIERSRLSNEDEYSKIGEYYALHLAVQGAKDRKRREKYRREAEEDRAEYLAWKQENASRRSAALASAVGGAFADANARREQQQQAERNRILLNSAYNAPAQDSGPSSSKATSSNSGPVREIQGSDECTFREIGNFVPGKFDGQTYLAEETQKAIAAERARVEAINRAKLPARCFDRPKFGHGSTRTSSQ